MTVYHHLGLGDHIICNGLVRELYKKYNTFNLYCYKHNYESVKNMYIDLSNLHIILVENENEIQSNNIIKVGFEKLNNRKDFDKRFYEIVDIPFIKRWDSFYYKRNIESENLIFNMLNPNNEKYIFIHDDTDRNFNINKKYIQNKNLKIIKPIKNITNNILDYTKILLNAEEYHCIDSSFKNLIDSYNINKELFLHYSYINKDNYYISSNMNNWKII